MDSDSSDRTSRFLFVGNLPKNWTGNRLEALGRQCGKVTQASCFYRESDQSHMGAGKITYGSPEEARAAKLILEDGLVEGRRLRVAFWSGMARREEQTRQDSRLALAVQGERIARSALASIAAGKSNPCEVAREALKELDDVGARRQILQDEEQEANSRALKEAASRRATSLAAQKAVMRTQMRRELTIELRQELME